VATNVGGLSELVNHEVDGFLEPVGDIDAPARCVVSLRSDPALYQRVSAAARQTAQARFCSSLVIPRYEAYYQEILARSV